jgi:hypothetical protein
VRKTIPKLRILNYSRVSRRFCEQIGVRYPRVRAVVCRGGSPFSLRELPHPKHDVGDEIGAGRAV